MVEIGQRVELLIVEIGTRQARMTLPGRGAVGAEIGPVPFHAVDDLDMLEPAGDRSQRVEQVFDDQPVLVELDDIVGLDGAGAEEDMGDVAQPVGGGPALAGVEQVDRQMLVVRPQRHRAARHGDDVPAVFLRQPGIKIAADHAGRADDQRLALDCAHRLPSTMNLSVIYSRTPSVPPSRPWPLSLLPPNGVSGLAPEKLLTPTMPHSRPWATAWACGMVRVNR
jgi:hypothetical protein